MELDFDLQFQTPNAFLGRFMLLFMRQIKSRGECKIIGNAADQFLKFSQFMAESLDYKPSHIAAAVLVLTLNIFAS
jgi:hypothetical protein